MLLLSFKCRALYQTCFPGRVCVSGASDVSLLHAATRRMETHCQGSMDLVVGS